MKWQAELGLATEAAKAAARLLLHSFSRAPGIQSEEGKDIKTLADQEAESCITKILTGSGIPVLGEEIVKAANSGLRWLVDPLDGTMNFTRGFPMSAVSIGLWEDQQPILGVIFDLPRGVTLQGLVGAGAWCEGETIRVSGVADIRQGILATGFPVNRDYDPDALGRFVQQVQGFKKVRMIGSAALSLACVARGIFDAYYEEDIMIWDVAGGLALVAAAGGRIEVNAGRMSHSVVAKATNSLLKF